MEVCAEEAKVIIVSNYYNFSSRTLSTTSRAKIDPCHKPHNACDKNPTIHHFEISEYLPLFASSPFQHDPHPLMAYILRITRLWSYFYVSQGRIQTKLVQFFMSQKVLSPPQKRYLK